MRIGRSAALTSVGVLVTVLLLSSFALGGVWLHSRFDPGCQGVSSQTKKVTIIGHTAGGVYSYHLRTGDSKGWQSSLSNNSGHSELLAGAVYFVGPRAASGCLYAANGAAHLRATWTWNLSVTPYLSANCTRDSNASANAQFNSYILGNVHTGTYPYYIFIPHLGYHPTFAGNVSCAGGGSQVYSPGKLGPTLVSIHSPMFYLWSGVHFDVYSSVYDTTETNATGAAVAYSAVTLSATFVSFSCGQCPP